MICRHCGAQMPDGKRFCTKCGQPVEAVAENVAAAPAASGSVAPEKIQGDASSLCPWCGASTTGTKFCPACGRPLDGASPSSTSEDAGTDAERAENKSGYTAPPDYSLPETPLEKLTPAAKQAGEKLVDLSKKAAEEGKKAAKEGGEAAKKAWASLGPFFRGLSEKWKAFGHKKAVYIGAACAFALVCTGVVIALLLAPKGAGTVAYNASNELNDGCVLVSGENVYIARYDGLYRVKTDGTGGERLSTVRFSDLQAAHGYVYGIDRSGCLWRVDSRKGQTEKIPFSWDLMLQMLVYGDRIYYNTYSFSEEEIGGLYRMALDGSSDELLAEGKFSAMQIADNKLYAMTADGRLLRFDLDGENVSVVWQDVTGRIRNPVVYRNKLYYSLSQSDLWEENYSRAENDQALPGIYEFDPTTGERTLVLETSRLSGRLASGFALDSGNGMLYCIKESETSCQLVGIDLPTGAQKVLREDVPGTYDWETVLVFGDRLAVYERNALDPSSSGTMLLCAADGNTQQPLMTPLAKSVAAVDGAAYFSTADGVYRIPQDGTELTKVADALGADLLAAGGNVYYNGEANGAPGVCGISRLDEAGATLVQQGDFVRWTVAEDGTPVFARLSSADVLCRGAQDAPYGVPICRTALCWGGSCTTADGWIYLSDEIDSDYQLLRVDMAGTESAVLYQTENFLFDASDVKASADGVYFRESGDLLRVSAGGEPETVAADVAQYVLYNGTVYYVDEAAMAVCSVIPGIPSSRTVLVRTSASSLAVQGQTLYYCDLLDKGALYALDLATGGRQRLADNTDNAADRSDHICEGVPEHPVTNDPYTDLWDGNFALLGNMADIPSQQPAASEEDAQPSIFGNEDMDGAAVAFGRFYRSYIEAIRTMDAGLLEYCSGPCADEMSGRIFNQNKDYVYDIVYLAVDFDSMELREENGVQTATFNTETYCMVYERDSGKNAGDNLVPRRVKAVKSPESGAWYINEIVSSHDRAPEVGADAIDVYPYI